jgi:hypothetical protein
MTTATVHELPLNQNPTEQDTFVAEFNRIRSMRVGSAAMQAEVAPNVDQAEQTAPHDEADTALDGLQKATAA